MAGSIPPEFIDALLTRLDIVDIIDARIPLKKAGRDYQALCPFHSEKTPSFTVSREKQFYHCFGCGAHGSAIGFLMDYDNMGFVEAIEELADLAGMEVPRDKSKQTGPDLKPIFAVLAEAEAFYQQQLHTHPQGKRALGYLRSRGLSADIIARFGIGYAPPGWDNLIRRIRDSQHQEQLLQAGMISEGDRGHYDRFRDRIMFPIRDHRGRTIGFGGRVLDKDEPKYLNSPETPIFHKGRGLYGLYEARKTSRETERLMVVEGYLDAIALAQFGIPYVVATLGTATTTEHIQHLFRNAPEIVFCFDGDRAGRNAAWKAMDNALPQLREGREARFLFLPQDEDPDSLIRREGAENFAKRITGATALSQFLFDTLTKKVDMNSLDGRARLAELARPYLNKLPKGVFQDLILNQLADMTEMDPEQLNHRLVAKGAKAKRATTLASGRTHMSPVRMAIALLLQHPDLAARYPDTDAPWEKLEAPGIPLLKQLLELLHSQPTLKQGPLLEHWRGTAEEPHLQKLLYIEIPIPETGIEREFLDALERLTQQYAKQETNKLLEKTRKTPLSDEEKLRLRQLIENSRRGNHQTE